ITGLVNGDQISAAYSCGATAWSSVGSYPITPSLVDPGNRETNYTVSLVNGSLTVNPAALTITANSRSKTYGQTVAFAGTEFTTSGLVNSDTVTGVTLASSGTAGTAAVAGAPYSIVP